MGFVVHARAVNCFTPRKDFVADVPGKWLLLQLATQAGLRRPDSAEVSEQHRHDLSSPLSKRTTVGAYCMMRDWASDTLDISWMDS